MKIILILFLTFVLSSCTGKIPYKVKYDNNIVAIVWLDKGLSEGEETMIRVSNEDTRGHVINTYEKVTILNVIE